MSRVGKRAIDLPSGIKAEMAGNKIKVEGKGKSLEHVIPEGFVVEIADNKISITRPSDSRQHKTLHGTTRSLVQNMVTGLSKGFQKKLQIQGVGYKAQMKGKTLVLDIGFSHTVNYTPDQDVSIETPTPTEILVKGVDKQKVGAVAAEIRAYYPPEPYKGKGIRYEGEYVRQKQGKSIA
ncbi:MAG: 50S ribosomal protein L6 [Candidatus Omnitrophica bacterium]|nr:50S ribosomal protein L6 [Candidatus Omnitrophota bacterium]MDD5487383.1 50S ribosomal protein L6 [Candidatus Omnitrophota bacterium]